MRQQQNRNLARNAIARMASAAGILTLLAMPAAADEAANRTAEDIENPRGDFKTYPRIEGSLLIEVENDNTFHSDDPGAEINDLYTTMELATGIYANQNFSLQSLIILEPALDPTPFEDRTFGDHGAYFEELFVQYENDRVRIFLGKFDAPFGTAWDATPGIYGTGFAEDYELAERIGGGVAVAFETMLAASNTLTVAGFFADTTALSESVFTNRGRTMLAAGGASNTESIESFSIALDSEEFLEAPGLAVHFGFDHQAAGIGDAGNENAFAIGFIHAHEIAAESILTVNFELAHLQYAGGGPTHNTYITLGGLFEFGGGWNIAAAGTVRRINQMGALPTISDYNAQISGGYEFQQGFLEGTTFDLGVGFVNDGGVHSTIFGILITREFEFELAAN